MDILVKHRFFCGKNHSESAFGNVRIGFFTSFLAYQQFTFVSILSLSPMSGKLLEITD